MEAAVLSGGAVGGRLILLLRRRRPPVRLMSRRATKRALLSPWRACWRGRLRGGERSQQPHMSSGPSLRAEHRLCRSPSSVIAGGRVKDESARGDQGGDGAGTGL